MTKDQINKRFAELAGIPTTGTWRSADSSVTWEPFDYCKHPDLVLEEMKDRKDYFDFINTVGRAVPVFTTVECFIAVDLIMDKTGLLALLAIRWMEEKKC